MNNNQTMGQLFDQHEADLLAQHKATTPDQLAAEEQRRQAQRQHEAKHTAIETDTDRANPEDYPQEPKP